MALAELEAGALTTSWNYCGEKMAVGFADGAIEVWQKGVRDGSVALSRSFKWEAHKGATAKLAWGPPEYGDILASCSTDGAIFVWEEVEENGKLQWKESAQLADNANTLDLQFGNCLTGLKLVAAGADGHARIYETSDSVELKHWQLQAEFPNVTDVTEKIGKCSCSGASISWKPPVGSVQQPIFALGYCTQTAKFSAAKIWQFLEAHQRWYPIAELAADDKIGEVHAISWAPNIGRSHELIAVAAGSTISIWQLEVSSGQKGSSVRRVAQLNEHTGQVWQVDWDMSGMTLASSAADGIVRLWQAGLDGMWRQQASFEAKK